MRYIGYGKMFDFINYLEDHVKYNYIAVCSNTADIILIVDESSSIFWADETNWNPLILNFLNNLVRSFDVGLTKIHIGLITFSDTALKRWDLITYLTLDSLVRIFTIYCN